MRILPALLAACAMAACARSPSPPAANTGEPAAPAPATGEPQPPSPPPPTSTPTPTPPPTAGTIPTRFQGNWAADAAACTAPGHESRLRMEAGRVQFHESSGTVSRATVNGDTLQLTVPLSGEGETWQASYRFGLSDGDRTLTDLGNGMVRRRCEG